MLHTEADTVIFSIYQQRDKVKPVAQVTYR